MKKEELLEIGLTEEQANQVFAMNGKDVEKYKKAAETAKTDLADAQAKLENRDKDLERLKATAGDAEATKKQLEELQTKYTTETEQYKAQLADRDYSDAISKAISGKGLKFSSKSAQRAFETALKEKKLELKDGELSGLDDFIKAQKEADPDAFASDKPTPRIVAATGNGGAPATGLSRAAQLAARYNENLYGKAKESD